MGRRKRIVLSDDSESAAELDLQAASPVPSIGDLDSRPSRKTKEEAKKKWEALVPGQARKKKKLDAGVSELAPAGSNQRQALPMKKSGDHKDGAQPSVKSGKSHISSRPPHIDPNASSESEDEPTSAGIHNPDRTTHTRQTKSVVLSRNTKPSAFDEITQDFDEEHSSDDEVDQDSGSMSEDRQEESTDKDDEELKAMEKNPQALAKTFAQEAAYWVEEDNSLRPSRSKHRARSKSQAPAPKSPSSVSHSRHSSRPPPTSRSPSVSSHENVPKQTKTRRARADHLISNKKRPARDDSDRESDAPPPKKPVKKTAQGVDTHRSKVKTLSSVSGKSATNAEQQATSGARKQTKWKRKDEIPQFREPNTADDAPSETDSIPAHIRKARSYRTPRAVSEAVVDEDEDSAVDDASATESESEDSGIEIVFPRKGKLKLNEQHRRVRRVVKRGIHTMLVNVSLKNAFPDGPQKSGHIIHRALLKAAAEFGYDDLVKRLKKQDEYTADLSKIPSQRIPAFRGQVRKLVDGQPSTALGLTSGDKEKGDWLQEGFRYIYPFDYETKTIKAGKPYSPPVFIETLRVAFFKRPSSFGFELSKHFESSLPEKPDEKEIPAAMLALVATALHAAIEDCKHGYKQPRDFTANDYWGVYKDHIQELSSIRMGGPVQYHVLMHGFWRQISIPAGSSNPAGAPRKSFLDVAAMSLEHKLWDSDASGPPGKVPGKPPGPA
ncbi:hypothetical protein C2E23DRAFT_882237 [Lenzites betulinus]|nr:hypothetical protein C2E23DRAFT_882237 [Lenzites betulinus]